MAYKAIVARVWTRPHPNADRIQLGECRGYQVIVGKDVEDGTMGVFFPPDGQLSDEYVRANDLYARDPETGEKRSGFFEKNRRVRAQNFRGQKSEGYWAGLESLDAMPQIKGYNSGAHNLLKEGDEIDSYRGVPLCQKYETPATRRAKANMQLQPRRQNQHFRKHFDTHQLKKEWPSIPSGAIVYFTEKLHGTSGRLGYVPQDVKPNWRQRLAAWLIDRGRKMETFEWTHLLGTRNVILDTFVGESYYGKEGFRYKLTDPIKPKLRKGETIYFEIVGFTEDGKPIMPSVDTKEVPAIRELYGDKMYYSYGCWVAAEAPGPQSKLFVYRITQTTPDHIPLELSWEQVKGRCEELGLDYVPEVDVPFNSYLPSATYRVLERAENLSHGPSVLDATHIREGVCVRWEKGKDMGILKHKSHEFLVLEGVVKSQDSYVDREEIS